LTWKRRDDEGGRERRTCDEKQMNLEAAEADVCKSDVDESDCGRDNLSEGVILHWSRAREESLKAHPSLRRQTRFHGRQLEPRMKSSEREDKRAVKSGEGQIRRNREVQGRREGDTHVV